jgi:peroxiredoxin
MPAENPAAAADGRAAAPRTGAPLADTPGTDTPATNTPGADAPATAATADQATEEEAALMAVTLDELRRTGAADHALRVGEPFPDFLLPDAEGRLVELADLLATGPAVLTFFRGDWCPFCRTALDALEATLPQLRAAGAGLAAVMPETGGRALDAKRRHRLGYRVLADVDHGLAMACGIAFRVPRPYRAAMDAAGIDLGERQGSAAWFLPVPATFVIDRAGILRWSFVELDFTRRAQPAAIVEAVRALGRG